MLDSSFWHALLLGVIQGIAEFLPISSSGHLIVVSSLLDGKPIPLTLNIALHMGTVLAVLLYFYKDWFSMTRSIKRRWINHEPSHEADVVFPALIVGSIPAGIIGILWQDEIEQIFHHPRSVILPLIIVGILMWVIDKKAIQKKQINSLTIKDAFLIGIAQACALIPGTSRSGATITSARLLGYKREESAKFSFLLGTPAMLGATLLNYKDLLQSIGNPVFYIGALVSLITGCLAIGFLLRFLQRFGLASFAIYRILLAGWLAYLIF